MARRFAKISEEEIKTAFFYPSDQEVIGSWSDLVNTKTTIPSGSVKSGGYIPRRFASTTTIYLPFGDSCILVGLSGLCLGGAKLMAIGP